MSLRASSRRTLSPSSGSLSGKIVSGVIRIEQQETRWCWAACMQMVLQSTGGTTQCEFVNSAFGQTDCCSLPQRKSSKCNKRLEAGKIKDEWIKKGFKCTQVNGTISFTELQDEIKNERPVEIGLIMSGGVGHVVLAVGWNVVGSVEEVIIYDPTPSKDIAIVPYDSLKKDYAGGKWWWTWIGIEK